MDYRQKGFTLLEVMLVVVILSVLAAIAIPRLAGSSDKAREKADIITAREVKAALDRYEIENGSYPTKNDFTAKNGKITAENFIPAYISSLDASVTQQAVPEENQGFGVQTLPSEGEEYSSPTNLIMIYLTEDGSAAEVRVYDKNLNKDSWLWSSN
ncbi:MAG: prepilin-type N-terminal cleavage/methylation domain-containing protein [Peptococcaceae bacterium]|nr:prepilin-type N-terminal cleavage/methylation domain-containing protein [Peptococcaceae bacterium]